MIQDKIKKLLDNKPLDEILTPYYEDLDNAEAQLKLQGKTIGAANREQGSLHFHYNNRRKELETLVSYYEMQTNKIRGQLYRKFTENFSIDLSERGKSSYIDKEPEYITAYEHYLTVKEIAEAFKAVVDAFEQRGYALRNITDLRVAGLDESLL